ncbi:MAG: hypothetical protein HC904_13675 [Blastochloris sp.]|nr:hypothetical protein [Blastochloris sp.]
MKVSQPLRLPRSRSFFGIHFDFHANADSNQIGTRPFAQTLEKLITEVRPDYVQCDCKGHPGYSSYPTKVGNAAPNIQGDPLKIWRRVTAKHGVSLYMHYSGVWDSRALALHPEWARHDEKGQPDPKNTSVFGPYAELFLLPQLQELREVYGVDGYWIDGECWATCQDYRPEVIRAFRQETGIKTVPRRPEDPHFFKFTEFCRRGFRKYLSRYVDAIHARCPGVEVASNWAFSSFMPGPVTAEVDFLSGDYTLIDSVNSARLEGRCLMHQGKPWDLMAWSFSSVWEDSCRSSKTALQLKQEAAMVLALGGGFQLYFNQRRDGSIKEEDIPIMSELARFCRERQKFCHGAKSVPQVALLYSTAAFYRLSKRIFSPWDGELNALHGTMNALLNQHCAVDILSEHQLSGRMEEFPLIVIPEWAYLEPEFKKELLDYVRKGGSLFVSGAKAFGLFAEDLDIKLSGEPKEQNAWLSLDTQMAGMKGLVQTFEIPKGSASKVWAHVHPRNDRDSTSQPVLVSRRLGRGRLTGLAMDFGARYRFQRTAQASKILGVILSKIFPQPLLQWEGSDLVDLSVMRQGKDLMLHLVNTSGPHDNRNCYTVDELTPLGPLTLSLRLPKTSQKNCKQT